MTELPLEGTTTEIVEVEGVRVFRTTIIKDQTVADIERKIAAQDTGIARTQQRAIAPMEARKAELEATLAELKA